MDSSKHHLGTEGCSSNESGWTMYIASPMQEDYDDDGEYCSYDVIENYHYPVTKDEQDSDDSMASDASSGPHKQETYQDHGGKPSSKSGSGGTSNGKSFNLFSSSAAKSNKKEKKNDGTSNDKNMRRLPANRRNSN